MRSELHSIAARVVILTASIYTAALQLFSTTSLAYRAAGDGVLIDLVNVAVLGLAGFGALDLVWRDALGKGLLLPGVDAHLRHQVCVGLYSALSGAFALRAFVALGELSAALQVAVYYVLISAGTAIEAAAIAHENRLGDRACQQESEDA